MKLTTAQAFDKFTEFISSTPAQREEVNRKLKKTRGYLETAFSDSSTMPLKRTILIGSAGRGTAIRPVENIDVMAQFVNKDDVFNQYRADSGAFLKRIARGIGATTSVAKIGTQGQAIRLLYADGPPFDIAPVFGFDDRGYAMPSGDGGWVMIDPEAQDRWHAKRCEEASENLLPIIKLARRWNQVHRNRFQPYHLEVVVANTFDSVGTIRQEALAKLFTWAQDYIRVRDPAGHCGRLDYYLSQGQLRAIRSRLTDAARRAGEALTAETVGDHATAKRLWRVELGDDFPVD